MDHDARFDAELAAEALRVHTRYVVEFVEALRICPWAERARLEGRTRAIVLVSPEPSREEVLEACAALGADATVEVGFVVFPRVTLGRLAFERFVSEVRRADAERAGLGGPPMAMAAFHFEAEPELGAAHRLVPFLRRSPDPTIQLVRRTVLDALRGPADHGSTFLDPSKIDLAELMATKKKPPLHERVAAINLETVRTLGVERVDTLLRALRVDRDEAYARLEERYR